MRAGVMRVLSIRIWARAQRAPPIRKEYRRIMGGWLLSSVELRQQFEIAILDDMSISVVPR